MALAVDPIHAAMFPLAAPAPTAPSTYLSRRSVLCILLLLLSLFSVALTDQTCYYPDGRTIARMDKPCNAGPGPSACCGPQADGSQAHCLSNGLCLTDLKVSRGSCTDASWNSSECASVCTKSMPPATHTRRLSD